MVDGTVEVYGNRGINNAGGPLVVRSIHVFFCFSVLFFVF